jgi:hypothetical protein
MRCNSVRIGHYLSFFVGLGFHVFFDARVQEADIRYTVEHQLAIQFQQ